MSFGKREGWDEVCFYCDMPLSTACERDHFPIPQRHGGTETVPACINCHNLKDRTELNDWPVARIWAEMSSNWPKLSPLIRVWLAKVLALSQDALAKQGVRSPDAPVKPARQLSMTPRAIRHRAEYARQKQAGQAA
jgi:hypothetical protein